MQKLEKHPKVLMALFTRGGGMGLQFLSTLVIARVLDPEGMGIYSVYLGWMLVLSGVISVGTPTLAMRRVSVAHRAQDSSQISRQMLALLAVILLFSLFSLSLMSLIGSVNLERLFGFEFMLYAGASGALFAGIKLFSEALKARDAVNTAMLFENIMMALLMLIFVGTSVFLDERVTALQVVQINLSVLALIFVFVLFYFFFRLPVIFKPRKVNLRDYLVTLPPLWGNILVGMLFLNAPLLLAPYFASQTELGLFGVAYRLIMINVNVLMVLAALFGPKFARLYADQDLVGLRAALNESRKLSLMLFAPIFLFVLIFPEFTLGLFGKRYIEGINLLLIMIVGQLVYASTGLVGLFLAMTDHAALEFRLAVSGALIMVLLISIAGSIAGIEGVALGFTLALGIKNLLSLYFAKRVLAVGVSN